MDIKLNSKYTNFQISNYIIIGFIVLVTLALNYILISEFGFNQAVFIPITTFLVIIAILLYKYLSKNLFDDFYQSDKEIDTMIHKTLHELNTPVATIQMNTKMLQKNLTNEKDIKRLQRIIDASNNLLELYSKTEYELSSKIDKVKTEPFDIQDIINKSLEKVQDIKGELTIHTNITTQTIDADMYGFEIVIDNLLSNAIKYNNPNGSITISNENGILEISDTGKGIEQKHLLQVYDKYFQIDSEHKGIGLGLSIVKEYCDKHNIKIQIESDEKKGTSFFLDLRLLNI